MIPKRVLWAVVLLIIAAAGTAVIRFVSRPGPRNPVVRPEQHVHALVASLAAPTGSGRPVLYAGTHRGLYVSHDIGRSWTAVAGASAELDLMALAVIQVRPVRPDRPGRPPVLYGAGHGFGVVKSLDAGVTWERVNTGLPSSLDVHALAVGPADGRMLYASLVDAGIYRSDDGAAHWRRVETGFENGPIMAIGMDPLRTDLLYAAGHGIGVLKTTDGGLAWAPLGIGDRNIMTLIVDPVRSERLFAAGRAGIYTSTDAGTMWRLTPLASAPLITGLALDPADPLIVYATSETGHVWVSRDGGLGWTQQAAALPL